MTESRFKIMKKHPVVHIGKDIGIVAVKHLKEKGYDSIMWGDCGLLDEIARKYRNDLLELHPLERHPRMLSAMERSGLFDKFFVRLNGFKGNNLVRCLKIKKEKETQKT